MKFNSLILFAIFSIFFISCEKDMKWVNPNDSKADQAEIQKICKQSNFECGLINVDYKGVVLKIDCGKCTDGYSCGDDNMCQDIDECENPDLNDCPEHSTCANEEGTYSCVCKENYSGEDCVPDTRTKACENLPEKAEWNTVSEITQTWNGNEWAPSSKGIFSEEASESECRFKCVENYNWNNEVCEPATREADCAEKPEHAEWNDGDRNGKFTQTWDGEEWKPEIPATNYSKEAADCAFVCETGYLWNGTDSCESAPARNATCQNLPENAQWNTVAEITQTYDGESWTPSALGTFNTEPSTTECRFKCNEGYEWNGSECSQN